MEPDRKQPCSLPCLGRGQNSEKENFMPFGERIEINSADRLSCASTSSENTSAPPSFLSRQICAVTAFTPSQSSRLDGRRLPNRPGCQHGHS